MPLFKYQPYYKYNGPTLSQPFREELNPDQVSHNMSLFFDEIGSYFTDVGATVEAVGGGFIGITADITQDDCDSRVKRCLNNLDLFANRIAAQ
ncbi:hypothetical protein [Stenotrophomonas maltophilia]|uniref:hypothetical protein n=1 Tax=Stenotrophomonas maltophilia TaxID=40324 RepID=UPI00066DBB34|nr:hypothetical protein [Stenotrophomonas maltophilia]